MLFLYLGGTSQRIGGPSCLVKAVAVEAATFEEANSKAERIIYFDGVAKGWDCPCCGDSWYRQDEQDEHDALHDPYTVDEIKSSYPGAVFIGV